MSQETETAKKPKGSKRKAAAKQVENSKNCKQLIDSCREYLDLMEAEVDKVSEYEVNRLGKIVAMKFDLMTAMQCRLLGSPLWGEYGRMDGTNDGPMVLKQDWSIIEKYYPDAQVAFMKAYVARVEPMRREKWLKKYNNGEISKKEWSKIVGAAMPEMPAAKKEELTLTEKEIIKAVKIMEKLDNKDKESEDDNDGGDGVF